MARRSNKPTSKAEGVQFDIVNDNFDDYYGYDIEKSLQAKLRAQDAALASEINAIEGRLAGIESAVSEAVTAVDDQLDPTSTSPVTNRAVSTAINEIVDKTVGGMEVEENEDSVTLSLLNKYSHTIAAVDLPKGGGSDTSVAKPRVTASVNRPQIKLGDSATLTYFYDHVSSDNVSDGIRGSLEITITRGSSQTFHTVLNNVAAGTTGTLDITPYLLAGQMDIYVRATCYSADGELQAKQAYTSIYVASLNLSSSFDISLSLTQGGYGNEIVTIPFTIVGSGTKIVTMYVDGVQASSDTISRSGTTNGTFSLDMSGLAPGRHNIQLVAERDGLYSESIFMDILKAGSSVPFIGTKIVFDDGRIYTSSLVPTISVGQFEQFSIEFVVWTPGDVSSLMTVTVDGVTRQSMSVGRQRQSYNGKFDEYGSFTMAFVSGVTTYPFNAVVSESQADISETTANLRLKLSAVGRSNGEQNPADWGGITSFKNVDFRSSGWTGEALKLINGASAEIDFKPFLTDAAANGLTIEVELMVDNVTDKEAAVLSCIDGGMGIEITAEEAHFYTGSTKRQETAEEDEHGNTIYREIPVGVAMKFASKLWLKIAFVLHTRNDNSLMELYINGVRSKADVYGAGDIFVQSPAKGISIDSSGADVQIRNLRFYDRAITDDEELSNYIVDRPDGTEMLTLYDNNDVMGEDDNVSADILRSKGKGVVIFVRANALDDVNGANDKKRDFLAEKVYWYSPFGPDYDFVAENINIRIQGTSSTKYPRKNYRLYLAKGSNPTLRVGGELVSGNKYSMRPNAIAMNLFCLKADYSDSSMTMNTGGAKLFDATMRQLELFTPPQRYSTKVRQAIDGIPCDVFCCTEDGGELTYYGQYNFNNEKSKSGKLFGMEGVDGFTPACPIALEALNNSNPCCLFQAPKTNLDAWLEANFDDGFEFNYPEDTFWSSTKISDPSKESVASNAQKTAIGRLMSWLATVTPANADYDDLSTFVSQQFKSEVSQYFDVNHLLTYYLITDYWGSVDQRAKNILWRTWDGLKWYATFYDGDTAMGVRNDSFLVYLYNMTRETWDVDAQKYAYEGHDSNLWCLVLANLADELKAACDTLRGYLTTERMLQMFNGEQQYNWCERLYNKSGEFKYIIPQITGVPVDGEQGLVKYSYMYALTGNREAHRTYFLRERGTLLDARYGTSGFQADNIDIYVNRTASEAANTITLKSGDLYYFGYRTNNGGWLDGPVQADSGESVTLTFTAALAINDPIRLCGASKITELDMRNISGHVLRQLGLNKCKMLRKIVFNTSLTNSANPGWYIDWSGCSQIEYVDMTGQTGVTTNDGGTEVDLSNQPKLKTLLLGNTGVTSVSLASGAPLTTLVLPSTITNLTLHDLPNLAASGLTIQGYSNVLRFSFSNCPGLNWQTLLDQCTNVRYVRVEGLSGIINSSVLEQYKNLSGIDANGNVVEKCRLAGTVVLEGLISDEDLTELQSYYPELTIKNAQFSHYWYDDKETNPVNVTNEDNKTGYAYGGSAAGFAYSASGHILKIRNRSQMVSGYINPRTHKMHVELLQRNNLAYKADGSAFNVTDPNGDMYDVFVYIPHYWYKGVNSFKDATKHFFLSSDDNCPDSTANVTRTYPLDDLLYESGKAVDLRMFDEETDNYVEDFILEQSTYMVCKVNVFGMKQVRFPSVANSFYGGVFTDMDGKVLELVELTNDSVDSPSDFYPNSGDYDFRTVPLGASFLYFTCHANIYNPDMKKVIVTDSADLEAIEPDWVEHKSELVGVYLGSAGGWVKAGSIPTTGLRSLGNKDAVVPNATGSDTPTDAWPYDENGYPTGLPSKTILWNDSDVMNLAAVRSVGVDNGEYQIMAYETNKDIANLIMVYRGSRAFSTFNIPGASTYAAAETGNGFGEFYTYNSIGPDVWGIKRFLGRGVELMCKMCINAPSWGELWRRKGVLSSWSINSLIRIMMRNGEERTSAAHVAGAQSNQCVMRVRFGRYCDIICSCTKTTGSNQYLVGYCNTFWRQSSRGMIYARTKNQMSSQAGYSYINHTSTNYSFNGKTTTMTLGRLCFWGEIENEDDILEQ